MKDHYKTLGVSSAASKEEIKKAFHKLAHKHHPHKGGEEKRFKEINEAYQVLSNDQRRAQYDQFGDVSENPSFNWRDFYSDPGIDFSNLGDIFEDFFGFGRSSSKRDSRRGGDINVDMEILLKETLKDAKKTFSLKKLTTCSRCKGQGAEPGTLIKECFSCRGTGRVQKIRKTFLGSIIQWSVCPECRGEGNIPEKPCNVCKGEGRIREEERIEAVIPAGVDTNQILKIRGKGEAGRRGGEAGDLYLRVMVKSHPDFERKGDDIYTTAEISFSQAVLGDKTELETLEEKTLELKIPSGTQSGKILKISNRGIPNFSGYGRGDLYIRLKVKTPQKISRKQKDLLKKLKEQGL